MQNDNRASDRFADAAFKRLLRVVTPFPRLEGTMPFQYPWEVDEAAATWAASALDDLGRAPGQFSGEY